MTAAPLAGNERLADLLAATPYRSYSYAYPHKTAYRRLQPPVPLRQVWADEPRDALFLYLHVPFCEMRCGFCNLFTTANPHEDAEAAYLAAVEREAEQVSGALGDVGGASFARMAIGGGTPTYLSPYGLQRLFDLAQRFFDFDASGVPVSIETSPGTATPDRLEVLRERGVDRVSIGVQSFLEDEVAAVGRSQRASTVHRAIEHIRAAGFPLLNLDLIYGIPGQTQTSWLASLAEALRHTPEELYLYPLYVRPVTGLERMRTRSSAEPEEDDHRLDLYRAGRDYLLEAGYEQVSMRMFRAAHAPSVDGPAYCCQEDGMVGLGCGARSYTRGLHYSTEWAVGAKGVRGILAEYISRPAEAFGHAQHGFILDGDEQRRRYAIQSVLHRSGLDYGAYQARFGTRALDDLPQLLELAELGLAIERDGVLRLNAAGIERSDTIGPWLYSPAVRRLADEYELR